MLWNTSTSVSAAVPSCTVGKGRLQDISLKSATIGADVPTRVYVPPCYDSSGRRYPYVILMHGVGYDQTQWTDHLNVQGVLDAGIANHTLPPMILVMPQGGDLFSTNIFTNYSWENVVVNELIPQVEKSFCTWNERETRAIGGISRGGFWAYEIGLRHADLFGAIGGHSPYFDPDNAPAAFNPLNLAQTAKFAFGDQPRFWLDVGEGDTESVPGIEQEMQILVARNMNLNYTLNTNGEHDDAYWSAHVREYLGFYGQPWPLNLDDLPSCSQ